MISLRLGSAPIASRAGPKPAREAFSFCAKGQHLQQQRVPRVAAAHPRHEASRHAQREAARGGPGRLQPFLAEAEQAEQFGRIGDCFLQGALPGRGLTGGEGCRYHDRLYCGGPQFSQTRARSNNR